MRPVAAPGVAAIRNAAKPAMNGHVAMRRRGPSPHLATVQRRHPVRTDRDVLNPAPAAAALTRAPVADAPTPVRVVAVRMPGPAVADRIPVPVGRQPAREAHAPTLARDAPVAGSV